MVIVDILLRCTWDLLPYHTANVNWLGAIKKQDQVSYVLGHLNHLWNITKFVYLSLYYETRKGERAFSNFGWPSSLKDTETPWRWINLCVSFFGLDLSCGVRQQTCGNVDKAKCFLISQTSVNLWNINKLHWEVVWVFLLLTLVCL